MVTGWSPSGQRVADADRGRDRPLDHPDGARGAEADQEAEALIRHVTENRQVYSGGLMIAVLIVLTLLAVVRRPVSRRSPAGISSALIVHPFRLRLAVTGRITR